MPVCLHILVSLTLAVSLLVNAVCADASQSSAGTGSARSSFPARRLSAYVYDLRNGEAYLAGARPQLVEVGPFVYDIRGDFKNVTFPQANTVQFVPGATYHFVPELSFANDTWLNITTLNAPFLLMTEYYANFNDWISLYELYSKFDIYKANTDAVRLLTYKTVRQVLFGWVDPVMQLVEMPPVAPLTNGTYCAGPQTGMPFFNAVTNVTHEQTLWRSSNSTQYCAFRNPCACLSPELQPAPLWGSIEANRVHGGAGEFFDEPVTPTSELGIWMSQLQRYMPLESFNTSDPSQVRFRFASNVWRNASEVPSNADFYQVRTPRGLLNYTIASGMPAFVSQPRFLDADSQLIEAVDLTLLTSNTSAREAESVWDVARDTGRTRFKRYSSMVNFYPTPVSAVLSQAPYNFSWFKDLVPAYVPVYWFADAALWTPPTSLCTFTNDTLMYDFSALRSPFGQMATDVAGNVFVFNVCGVARSSPVSLACFDVDATVCYRAAASTEWTPVARLPRSDAAPSAAAQPLFSFVDSSNPSAGVRARYTNGWSYDFEPAVTEVIFLCGSALPNAPNTTVYRDPTTGVFTVVLVSTAGCAIVPSPSSTGSAAPPVPDDPDVELRFELKYSINALPGNTIDGFATLVLTDISSALNMPPNRLAFGSVVDGGVLTVDGEPAPGAPVSIVVFTFRVLGAASYDQPTATNYAGQFISQSGSPTSQLLLQPVTRATVVGSAQIIEEDNGNDGVPGWGVALIVIACVALVVLVAALVHVCRQKARTPLADTTARIGAADPQTHASYQTMA